MSTTVEGVRNGTSNKNTDKDIEDKNDQINVSLPKSILEGIKALKSESKCGKFDFYNEEFVFINNDAIEIQVQVPRLDHAIDLQVNLSEAVQEVHHMLMDREETCTRTCFSLYFEGVKLDRFSELRNAPDIKHGSVLNMVEESYTVREARIHLRHIRDLIRSLDQTDAFNGQDCRSLTYLPLLLEQFDGRRNQKATPIDCTPPPYLLDCGTFEDNKFTVPLSNLYTFDTQQQSLQPIKYLATSGWNPPVGSRKLQGDLLYLVVITNEERTFHVTCCRSGFYVNQSTDFVFNSNASNLPNVTNSIYHNLAELLCMLSPSFKKTFSLILKRRREKHPLERAGTSQQVYTWFSPVLPYTVDMIRAEDANSSKLGYEEHLPGQTRDWNEELQTIRSLPKDLAHERLVRDRAMYKIQGDFVAAAVRGAQAIIDGNVLAINPGSDKRLQMFIWHGIFFSLGFDVSDHYRKLGGDAAAHIAPSLDLKGVNSFNAIDIHGLHTVGTVIVDYRGFRVVAQTIIPGIMDRDQEESVVYGSIDFGANVTSTPEYSEILRKYACHLVSAPHCVYNADNQSIIFYTSVETKGIIGNDGRLYILDLLRTFAPDVNFLVDIDQAILPEVAKAGFPRKLTHKLACFRHSFLSMYQKNEQAKFTKYAIHQIYYNLIADLTVEKLEEPAVKDKVMAFVQQMALTFPLLSMQERNKFELVDFDQEHLDVFYKLRDICSQVPYHFDFNPDAFSPLVRHDSKELLQRYQQMIRNASDFLVLDLVPRFVKLYCERECFQLFDGYMLTQSMHKHGINVRYLGLVLDLIYKEQKNFQKSVNYFISICVSEIVSRSAKHIFKEYIRRIDNVTYLSKGVALFLNCYLAKCDDIKVFNHTIIASSKRKNRKNRTRNPNMARGHGSMTMDTMEWMVLDANMFFELLIKDMESCFGFTCTCKDIHDLIATYRLNKVSLLRRFCQQTGVQIAMVDYAWDDNIPIFTDSNVLNMFPIVKRTEVYSIDVGYFWKSAISKLHDNSIQKCKDILNDALNLMNNVYGAVHPQIVMGLNCLARIHYFESNYQEAVNYQLKSMLMREKLNGIDSAESIPDYINLALFSFASNHYTDTLHCFYRAKYLLLLVCGPIHPRHAILNVNIGLVLFLLDELDASYQFFTAALKIFKGSYSQTDFRYALCHHLIAVVLGKMKSFREALGHEIESYRMCKNSLGEDHPHTQESSRYLKILTQSAVKMQKLANAGITSEEPEEDFAFLLSKHQSILKLLHTINYSLTIPQGDAYLLPQDYSYIGDFLMFLNAF